MPLISVIMPAYNAEKTISAAIESVLSQTLSDFELIVIDDCSKDNTYQEVSKIRETDERIKLIRNLQNLGVSATRNIGVEIACGEIIAFLDSDDLWKQDKLEKQVKIFESDMDAALSFTASSFIDENGESYEYIMNVPEKVTYKQLLKRNVLSCSSVMVKSSVMKQIKMPNDSMHEDYYTWLMILKKHNYAYGINEPLLVYRLSSNSKSSSRIKSAKMLYRAYRALGYNFIITSLFVFRYMFYSIKKRRLIKKS